MRPITLVLPIVALAALSGCASGDSSPSLASSSGGKQCFYNSDVRSFSDAGPDTALVSIGSNDAWELTLSPGCPRIDTAAKIAIVARSGGRICAGSDAELIVPTASGASSQRCMVRNVRKLTPEEAVAVRGGPPKT